MDHEELRADFLLLSSALTGFTGAELHGTGMLDTYIDVVADTVGADVLAKLCRAGRRAVDEGGERALQERVLEHRCLGPVARCLTVLWYTGAWTQLPVEWRNRYGANVLDRDRVVSARAYREGLMWPAIGAHPSGAKAPGFASWVDAPKVGGPR